MPFAGFSDRELQVIALRTNGIRPGKIALQLGCHYNTVLNALRRVYDKVGFTDLALLTRWAIKNGLDEDLGPETSETRPHPGMPAARREGIKLGRIRRSRLERVKNPPF